MDISKELYDEIHVVIQKLMNLDPEKDSPAGELFLKIAKAFSEYEDNFFKFKEINNG